MNTNIPAEPDTIRAFAEIVVASFRDWEATAPEPRKYGPRDAVIVEHALRMLADPDVAGSGGVLEIVDRLRALALTRLVAVTP